MPPETFSFICESPAATEALAHGLALYARPGFTILLEGDLGAGKSTFARAFIKALGQGQDFDVPSPTFALIQTYDETRLPVVHIDLYRLEKAGDLSELGLDDLAKTHVALVEWPRAELHALSPDIVRLKLEGSGQSRLLTAQAHGAWAAAIKRNAALDHFLKSNGIDRATRRFLEGDASSRRYEKVTGAKGQSLILMDMPKRPDGPPIKNGKPYSAIAHLAEGLREVVGVNDQLEAMGYAAPRILACDVDQGFALLEDLGDRVFGRMRRAGENMKAPMQAAVEVLADMSAHTWPHHVKVRDHGFYALPHYDVEAQLIEVDLLPAWFSLHVNGKEAPDSLRASFAKQWREILPKTQAAPPVWVLRDFHSPNLLWLPGREGIQRVGLIDTQDALLGHPAYDLASLLQDARVDIADEEQDALFAHYLAARRKHAPFDEAAFTQAYAILGAQRASKILGIFARLNYRDGKPQYIAHMPRVSRYLARNLEHKSLHKLKRWFDKEMPEALAIGRPA